jgi:hypothetical protein
MCTNYCKTYGKMALMHMVNAYEGRSFLKLTSVLIFLILRAALTTFDRFSLSVEP